MKYRFTAKECSFQGTQGYMVKQYQNDVVICEQFKSMDAFEKYQEYLASEGYGIDFEN